jgi:hypothetical protein
MVGPSISTTPIFVFEAANVPWELDNEKIGTVNIQFYLVYRKRQSFLSVIINKR